MSAAVEPAAELAPAPGLQFSEAVRLLVQGKNINAETLLATDYLNHFNEVVMLIEMVGSAPEFMPDIAPWRPKSYADHFRDSNFSDRDLAIQAYEHAPLAYRVPFDETVAAIDALILSGIQELGVAVAAAAADDLDRIANITTAQARTLIDRASGIIHGHTSTSRQDEIDRILDIGDAAA